MKERIGTIYRINLIKHLGLDKACNRVLDIGCHNGYFLSKIEAHIKIGIDLSLPENRYEGLFVCADANYLPFKKECFDYIFAMDIIEHIEKDSLLSESLNHVLVPNGKFIITTPSENIRLNPWFLTKAISIKWGHIYRLGYSSKRLQELFSENFSLTIQEWNAWWWRFLYLLIRFTSEINQELTVYLIKQVAHLDSKKTSGKSGYLVVFGEKV